MDKIRIGIIGLGGIANGVHIPGLLRCDDAEITAICDINEKALNTVGDNLGLPQERRFTNYKDLIACPDVDALEICTPNHLHVPFALEAVKAGKAVNIEKPLSVSLDCAMPLKEALEKNPIKNMMCFSYRFRAAVRYAKYMVENNMFGDIVSMNIAYLQSGVFIKNRPLEWRFVKEYAGTGVLGDLGVHLIDLAEFLAGKITAVSGNYGTVVKKRRRLDSDEMGDVTTDDYCNFIAEMESGTVATFSVTKCAIGHSNTIRFDVFGTKGTFSFDLTRPEILNVCMSDDFGGSGKSETLSVPSEYFYDQERMFIDLLQNKECKYLPTVEDGLRSQKILDSILKSADEKRWVKID